MLLLISILITNENDTNFILKLISQLICLDRFRTVLTLTLCDQIELKIVFKHLLQQLTETNNATKNEDVSNSNVDIIFNSIKDVKQLLTFL